MAAFGLMATACGNLDNPLEDIQGSGNSSSENNSEDEVIAKYEFKVTDLTSADVTDDITSLKMTKADGSVVATATVDADGKLTVAVDDLAGITAGDYWFEAKTASSDYSKYIAKVSVDPSDFSTETAYTLTMAALGDLVGQDGNFYVDAAAITAASTTAIGVIGYIGMDNFTENGTVIDDKPFVGHGLVLCLKNTSTTPVNWSSEDQYAGDILLFPGQQVSNVNDLKRTENVSGYSNTKKMTSGEIIDRTYPAAEAAKEYTGLMAPEGTTGWFLPSAQQWLKVVEGLGGASESNVVWSSLFEGAVINKWETALSKAGTGNFDDINLSRIYWCSSESSDNAAVRLNVTPESPFYDDFGVSFGYELKYVNYDYSFARPFLAF